MSKNKKTLFNKLQTDKIKFYVLSLWLLFFLILLLTIDIPFIGESKFNGWLDLLDRNWLAIVSLIMIIIGVCISFKMKHDLKGVQNPPVRILKLKNENYEYLTFLTTCIIPLICVDFNNIRYAIVLFILLVVIGVIFVKMNLYLGNPTLALLGYHLYRIEVEGIEASEGIVVISKDKLAVGKSIKWIKIGDFVWVAKEHK